MADTAPAIATEDSPASRQIRVFLSSTFRDFMEERDLLVKQVFPALRRRAQERGVEVVDVDLRWGITEEESQQGKVIGICLAEIERCRPYFIGMLGERYGWMPKEDEYPKELFERDKLQWLRDHQGNASVTELEILHGVLNDKEMAGRAFFYFRDPRWNRYPDAPGFVCESEEEARKLTDLKQRIRTSGFPVAEHLPDPKAIADRIEADLWALIDELYPDLDQADALEREARKHAGYRQSRLGVYLGQQYIYQLSTLVSGGEQKILITGESGSGKSALIANWMHQHDREHPGDLVYAHHLGCSNDANAIRPLLARMLDTASRLLLENELIFEPIKVPQDWWELTAKVVETLQDLGRWCRTTGHRWIWVLDGLDRLDADDQRALPWLPLLIPEGVSVVISALQCPARSILEERQFRTLTIVPLQRPEQDALIERYLERFTKKLEPERRQQILNCELATSPLFLKVLLEELRQCGRFETLKEQIEAYIRPKTDGSLAVSDLYERVLERLEGDCGVEVVRKVMTALWASRAGLGEPELLAITGLTPLQWAPIDLALEQALGRNEIRLVFDNDYLGQGVEARYLSIVETRRRAHSELADWFGEQKEWNERKAYELPWQLAQSRRSDCLRRTLTSIDDLENLAGYLHPKEILEYWRKCMLSPMDCIDRAISAAIEDRMKIMRKKPASLAKLASLLSDILEEAGLHGSLLYRLRTIGLEACRDGELKDLKDILAPSVGSESDLARFLDYNRTRYSSKSTVIYCSSELSMLENLANSYYRGGRYSEAQNTYVDCIHGWQNLCGWESLKTHSALSGLAMSCSKNGMTDWAEVMHGKSFKLFKKLKGKDNPVAIRILMRMAINYSRLGKHRVAEQLNRRCYSELCRICGHDHQDTLAALNNLGASLARQQKHAEAIEVYQYCADRQLLIFGENHPKYRDVLRKIGKIMGSTSQ